MPTDPKGLPSKIKVGVNDYALVVWNPSDARDRRHSGETSHLMFEIRVDFTTAPTFTAETLLHEIMHAAWWNWYIKDSDDEERTITTLSGAIACVWRDNPAVFAWIAKHLK